jgi:hypothetical protein
MRDLWNGLATIALNNDLRQKVKVLCKFDSHPEYAVGLDGHPRLQKAHLQDQPNVEALRNIYKEFKNVNVHLSAYALAEVNRWFLDGGQPFLQALDALADALRPSITVSGSTQSSAFLEAVGALVSDPEFRDKFGKGEKHLHEFGFEISPAEEEALRVNFAPSTAADVQADLIFQLGWSGSGCNGRLMPYLGMFHPNM